MIVVIDGYNILRSLYTQPLVTDKERHEFIRRIVRYAAKKNLEIKLVFDGGAYGMPDRERQGLVDIIFTGARESADEWIMRFIDQHKGHELAIVSSDRELVVAAQQAGVLSVRAKKFHQLLHDALHVASSKQQQTKKAPVAIRKVSPRASDELDELMYGETSAPPTKDSNVHEDDHGLKRSKKERKRHQKLKKL